MYKAKAKLMFHTVSLARMTPKILPCSAMIVVDLFSEIVVVEQIQKLNEGNQRRARTANRQE